MTAVAAGLVEIGDFVEDEKVSGWFIDGKGRVNLEYGGRWHRFRASEKLEVTRQNVRRFLDLSTGHIPHSIWSNKELMEDVATMAGEFGWLVYVPDPPEPPESDLDELKRYGELMPVIQMARELGCDYILFDGDGPVDDKLKFYARDRWYTCDECAHDIFDEDHELHSSSCSMHPKNQVV